MMAEQHQTTERVRLERISTPSDHDRVASLAAQPAPKNWSLAGRAETLPLPDIEQNSRCSTGLNVNWWQLQETC